MNIDYTKENTAIIFCINLFIVILTGFFFLYEGSFIPFEVKYISCIFILIFIPGTFFIELLFQDFKNIYFLIGGSLILGISFQMILGTMLLYFGVYSKFGILLLSFLFIIFTSVKLSIQKKTFLFLLKDLNIKKFTPILLISSIVYLLRYLMISQKAYWSDRFSYPFIYILDEILLTNNFVYPLKSKIPTIASGYNQVGSFPGFIIVNANFLKTLGVEFQYVLHHPFFATFLLPIVLTGVSYLILISIIPNIKEKKFYNLYKNYSIFDLIYLFSLFIPSNHILLSSNPTGGGFLGNVGYCFIWLSLGLKFYLVQNQKNLKQRKIISIIILILWIDLSLNFSYRTFSLVLWLMTLFLSAYVLIIHKSKKSFLILSFIELLIVIYQLSLFIVLYSLTNAYLHIPSSILSLLPSSLRQVYIIVFIILLAFLILKTVSFLLSNKIRSLLFIFLRNFRSKISIKWFLIGELFIIIFALLIIILFRFIISVPSLYALESESVYSINIVFFLRLIEDACISLSFIYGLNLVIIKYLKQEINDYLPLFLNAFSFAYFAGTIAMIPIILLSLGPLLVIVRVPNYLLLILLVLSIISFLKLDNKLIRKGLTNNILGLSLMTAILMALLISSNSGFQIEDSITNEEFNNFLDLKYEIDEDHVIYTDLRLVNGLISILHHINATYPKGGFYGNYLEEISSIWYSDNSSSTYNYLKSASTTIDFILLSRNFIEDGIVGYEFHHLPLTLEEFSKFYDSDFFEISYNGSELLLIRIV